MRLLFDENMPVSLSRLLPGHECDSVIRLGCQATKNGALLSKAEKAGFHVLVTLDCDMDGEQNLSGRTISIFVLRPRGQGKEAVNALADQVMDQLQDLQPSSYVEIEDRG